MATLIESLPFFSDITDFFIPFLLVSAVTYGFLMKSKFISDKSDLNGLVALGIGLLVAMSGVAKFITKVTPLFASLFIIIFLILMVFLFFNIQDKITFDWLGENKPIVFILVGISIIFVFYAVGSLYGPNFYKTGVGGSEVTSPTSVDSEGNPVVLGPDTCDFSTLSGMRAVSCMLGHPKVIGTLLMLGLMAVAAFFIIYVPSSPKK